MSKIIDFISGELVNAGPEETNAVQPLLKIFVQNYGYPKSNIQSHPQYHVKVRPSDFNGSVPVDIVVFDNNQNPYIIAECKAPNVKKGMEQLKNYLTYSSAFIGVWFNGIDLKVIRKTINKMGQVEFLEIPTLPMYNQAIDDIGKITKEQLKKPENIKQIFSSIRNKLIAQATGTTRDEEFAKQIINLIFCKLYDEKNTKNKELMTFQTTIEETNKELSKRIQKLFKNVKDQYKDIFDDSDNIELDDNSLKFVVGQLQNFILMHSDRDAIGAAFEVFIGKALKGSQGQFFTPRNVIKFITSYLNITYKHKVIDPAAGTGGFLIESIMRMWESVEQDKDLYGWSETDLFVRKQEVAIKNIKGIDKDSFLSKVAKAHMTIIGDGKSGIFCENSLKFRDWNQKTKDDIQLNSFDFVITNPPFGKNLKIIESEILKEYELGREGGRVRKSQTPQILFIELCVKLLKDGGTMALVLPEGIFGNKNDRYIWEFLKKYGEITDIISLPNETFQPHTSYKSSILIFRKEKTKKNKINFIKINTVGHDKDGKVLYKRNDRNEEILVDNKKLIDDDLLNFSDAYEDMYSVRSDEIIDNIYMYQFYKKHENNDANTNYKEFTIRELIKLGIIESNSNGNIPRGSEIGTPAYKLNGDIKFIRTTDINNLEINYDTKKTTNEKVFEKYNHDVKDGDILFNKDGTFLIGKNAMVVEEDGKILYQSHILKFRILENEYFDKYYFLYLLNKEESFAQYEKFTFKQGSLSTLGDRILDVKFKIDIDKEKIAKISKQFKEIVYFKQMSKKVWNELKQKNNK